MADRQYTPEELNQLDAYANVLLAPNAMEYGHGQHPLQAIAQVFRAAQGRSTLNMTGRSRLEQRQAQGQRAVGDTLPNDSGPPVQTSSITPNAVAQSPDGGPRLAQIRSSRSGATFSVAQEHQARFQGLIDDLEAAGVNIDPRTSGGYANRNIRGTRTPSQHASGRAVDINWGANAQGTRGELDPNTARTIAARHGFTWGGDWQGNTRDPMHFEINDRASPAAPPQRRFPVTMQDLPPANNSNVPPVSGVANEGAPEAPPMQLGAGDLAAPQLAEAAAQESPIQQAQAPGGGLPPSAGGRMPMGVPRQIAPDPNLQILEGQLRNAGTLSQEELTNLSTQYRQLAAPQARETAAGTAYYDGRSGRFLYMVPKMQTAPLSVGRVGTQQQYFITPEGRQDLPNANAPPAGGRPPAGSAGAPAGPLTPSIGPMPPTSDVPALLEWDQNAEAQGAIAQKNASSAADAVSDISRRGLTASDNLKVLNQIHAATVSEGGRVWRGPRLAEITQQINQYLSNVGHPLGSTQALPESELISKMVAQLSSSATQELSARGTNFQLSTFMQNFPGLATSYNGALLMLDLLRQMARQDEQLGRRIRGLSANSATSVNDEIARFHNENPIYLNMPSMGGQPPRRIFAGTIRTGNTSEMAEDIRRIPEGVWFIDPRNGRLAQRGNRTNTTSGK